MVRVKGEEDGHQTAQHLHLQLWLLSVLKLLKLLVFLAEQIQDFAEAEENSPAMHRHPPEHIYFK
jgi:hypothetical protein